MITQFGWTKDYLTKDGKPWYPVMGEFHYARFSPERWGDNLRKMKALGVDIVATYCIWIYHEEEEGVFRFDGSRCLRDFLAEAKEAGLYVFLRIGPWCHAEARNGGFPDWLMHKNIPLRTDDPEYLTYVRRYYSKLFEQADGFFPDQGGPVLGIQIENEYGHVGGAADPAKGEQHMKTLTAIAREIGFRAPYFTATGWGGAFTGGNIPVMGGYCEAPWDQRLTEIEPSVNYLFTPERDDHVIGSDSGHDGEATFDEAAFPYLTAELGGGLQVTKHRRPVARAKDIAAMTLAKMGSGANLLGYYMFCGGTNPHGKLSTLQESKAVGDINDLPEYSYDFNAPVRQYGDVTKKALYLKLYFQFLHDFGENFATMKPFFPKDEPEKADDRKHLRVAYRENEAGEGFVFVNNFLRRQKMAAHKDVVLKAGPGKKRPHFDPVDIEDGDFFFYPYNMPVGTHGGKIVTVNAQPLCRLERDGEQIYVFVCDDKTRPEQVKFRCEGDLSGTKFVVLPLRKALQTWKVRDKHGDLLLLSKWPVLCEKGNYTCEVTLEDGSTLLPKKLKVSSVKDGVAKLTAIFPEDEKKFADQPEAAAVAEKEKDGTRSYRIRMHYPQGFAGNVILKVKYEADTMDVFLDSVKEDDSFYTGQTYRLDLGYYHNPEEIRLDLHRLYPDTKVFLEKWPEKKDKGWNRITEIRLETTALLPVKI